MNADNIKKLRASLDMTRLEFARLIGNVLDGRPPSYESIEKWENGTRRPSGKFARALKAIPRYIKDNPDILLRV